MSNAAALEVLMRKLADLERKGNGLLETINDLRAEDGLAPLPPFSGKGGGSSSSTPGAAAANTQIRPDSFYGKKLQTAVREFLEMRMAAAGGATSPATPREIYEAITHGGYEFDAKDETTALIGLRQLLRKRTAFFHKLPNGTYGLTVWYPDAKRARVRLNESEEENEEEESKTATPKKGAAA